LIEEGNEKEDWGGLSKSWFMPQEELFVICFGKFAVVLEFIQ